MNFWLRPWSEAGGKPAARWNLAYHARASRSATSVGPICDQEDSVMELLNFIPLKTYCIGPYWGSLQCPHHSIDKSETK